MKKLVIVLVTILLAELVQADNTEEITAILDSVYTDQLKIISITNVSENRHCQNCGEFEIIGMNDWNEKINLKLQTEKRFFNGPIRVICDNRLNNGYCWGI